MQGLGALPAVGLLSFPSFGQQLSADEDYRVQLTAPDAVTSDGKRFLSAAQFAALEQLCLWIAPSFEGRPGAAEAGTAAFLDFYASAAPKADQLRFQAGLEELNRRAQVKFAQPFAKLSASQAAEILAPLREPWVYAKSKDPFKRFLREAKMDIIRATNNSRAVADAGGRRAAGMGAYWNPAD